MPFYSLLEAEPQPIRWLPRAPDGERYGYHAEARAWVFDSRYMVGLLAPYVAKRLGR